MRRALCTVVALLVAVPAAAQQPPMQPTERLPPVVVEGTRATPERTAPESEAREEIRRVPGGVDLMGEQQIKESRGTNLKDVLDFTPAADGSQVSIRDSGLRNNFHLRGVNILLDGFPYGMPTAFPASRRSTCSTPSVSRSRRAPTPCASAGSRSAGRSTS